MFKKYMNALTGIIKFGIAAIFYVWNKNSFEGRQIWLVCEKKSEARDNGFHFFEYAVARKKDVYYVIEKKAADASRLKTANVIYYNSIQHFVYYLASQTLISSQTMPFPSSRSLAEAINHIFSLRKIKIWLQHGVTKDYLMHQDMDYSIMGYDLVCCASDRERDFIINNYGYPPANVKTLGFCRFDTLPLVHHRKRKRQILVMPTFRKWLGSGDPEVAPSENDKNRFTASDFFRAYTLLLNSPELREVLNELDIDLVFYPHYALQKYIDCFNVAVKSETHIIIADRFRYDVQELLVDSDMLITDYSSVFFDFAYMRKPELFYQFDFHRYRNDHYSAGYFDYLRDGFGEVVGSQSELIRKTLSIVRSGFSLDSQFEERIRAFFKYQDNSNSSRTFKAVQKINQDVFR